MVYFDNSSTTAPSKKCIAAVLNSLDNNWGNPSSLHKLGISAEKDLSSAREEIARRLSCDEKEIIFTSGGTEANNLAIFGSVETLKRRGTRIVTTEIEHHSVTECFDKLEKQGFEVIRIKPDKFGRISYDDIYSAIDEKTIFVSIMLVNNEVGSILPINAARDAIRDKKAPAYLHTDAVQAFGKIPVDVKDLEVDLLTVSAHKIHGPKGVGSLYKSAKCRIQPTSLGGLQEKGLRGGTEAASLICGMGAAASEIDLSNYEKVKELNQYLREQLKKIDGVVINSDDNAIPYILNFSLLGYRSETLLHFFESKEIYVSSGSACAKGEPSHVLKSMGLDRDAADGAIRLSFSSQNTKEEADVFVSALIEAKETLISKRR